jgi:hypothetical protein
MAWWTRTDGDVVGLACVQVFPSHSQVSDRWPEVAPARSSPGGGAAVQVGGGDAEIAAWNAYPQVIGIPAVMDAHLEEIAERTGMGEECRQMRARQEARREGRA